MDRDKTSAPYDGVREAAVAWFLRIQDGFSQSDFRQWRQWLAEDDRHAEAFDTVTAFWQEADQVCDLPWPSGQELQDDTYDPQATLPLPARSHRPMRHRHKGRRLWLAAAASIATVSVIGLMLLQYFDQDHSSYRTATAEHRTIHLQDGSSITLGAESDVVVVYTRHARAIELRSGEAYFKVAKDNTRPFVVAAGTRTVRALGTEFDVNIGVRDIRVSVLEGRVRVEGPPPVIDGSTTQAGVGAVLNLSSGDVLDFNAAGRIGIISKVDPKLSTSWLEGRLAYVGATLESVIADVNRYSENELIIGDEATRQLVFTGTIFSNDIDNWLAGLENVFPLRLVPVDGHGILLIQNRP